MDTINQRLIFVMEHFNLTPSSFASKLGINRSSMSHIISGRNKPGLEIIQKLFVSFPAIDLEWVLTGAGEMVKGNERRSTQPSLFKEAPEAAETINLKPALNETKTDKEFNLLDTIEKVYTELDEKKAEIEKLKLNSKIPNLSGVKTQSVKRITLYYANGNFEDFYPEGDK